LIEQKAAGYHLIQSNWSLILLSAVKFHSKLITSVVELILL